MGANESAAGRSNGTTEEEDEQQQQQRNNRSSIGDATAIAATAGVAVAAAWGLSRMLSSPLGHGFTLSTDGACHPENEGCYAAVQRGPSGYGGVLRDDNNGWVKGFMGFIRESDCLTAEIHGILKGLEFLDKLNIKGITLETDCRAAYQFIEEKKQTEYHGKSQIIRNIWSTMIEKCWRLKDKNHISIKLISREDNKYADKLANMAIERQVEYVEIKQLPYELEQIARARSAT